MFVKLFGSILDSTVWQEPATTRVVWITMLAMADEEGQIRASLPGLAKRAGVTLAECETALGAFLRPDPYSSTKENEGRRIEAVDGGWFLLNYAKYRAIKSKEDRREYERDRKREQRKREKVSHDVPDKPGQSRGVPQGPALSTHAEAEAEADAEAKKGRGGEPLSAAADGKPDERRTTSDAKPEGHRILSVTGLVSAIRREVEALHPELGLYMPGNWADRAAQKFIDTIPKGQEIQSLEADILRRITVFAASEDLRITRGKWSVEAFCEAFNQLAPAAAPPKRARREMPDLPQASPRPSVVSLAGSRASGGGR